jgi:hypothetical protein
VGLVDADKGWPSALETGSEGTGLQRLRRSEDDEPAAGLEPLERGPTLGQSQSAVEDDDGDAAALERSWSAMRAMSGETTIVGRSTIIAGT